ncbi:MAG: histidine--tRNA ligase [Candidatus Omnitrophica bacterium CG11_big_fil_rev_8_21_14_0_20_41_12]|nr:MAG: histidine--tRNA ligase [Candidatus Omnitrophica bacterium CG11_big_fil_rev_8_21_14_0_20_41_12]
MFKRVPGTKDILPNETPSWQRIETEARKVFSLYNYQEIRTPIIEDAALFNRTLGATTEIVQKQMFIIHNQEDTYALRPEGTASIVRSYLENSLDKTSGFTKLYYIGPMFRLERPQKGRLRQFHHIGCEAIGSQDAALDVEVIALASQLLENFGITGYKIILNSLGCLKDKQALSSELEKNLSEKSKELCCDCQERLKKNVLRVLDCKNEKCRLIVKELSVNQSHLCPDCLSHFEEVKKGLKLLNIPFEIQDHLVRGLDYYNRTVFEITHSNLGSQDAIAAGGRYNNLVRELGGPELGGIGFAFGVERLFLAAGERVANSQKKLIYLITLGEAAKETGIKILNQLRKNNIACDTDYLSKSLKGALRAANDAAANLVLILGDDELKNNIITLKDMSQSTQKEVKLEDLVEELKC